MLIVTFGLAASGKTFVSRIIGENFGFHVAEADEWLPENMQHAINAKETFTDSELSGFVDKIIHNITELQNNNCQDIVISQALYRDKNRRQILKAFPDAQFLEISARPETIEKRLLKRNDWVDADYAHSMQQYFEPMHDARVIDNDSDGEAHVLNQLHEFFKHSTKTLVS
jgi:gluconate kinase